MSATPVLSLRGRLTAIILLPLMLIALGVGLWQFAEARDTAHELFDRSLRATALAIEREISISGGGLPSERTRDLLRDTSGGQVFYHVYAPDGVFAKGFATPPVPAPGEALPSGDQAYFDGIYFGQRVRALRLLDETEIDGISGTFTFTIWQQATVRDALVRELALRSLIVIFSLTATVALVVWYGVGIGLRPLLDLQDAISRRSPRALSPIRRPVPPEAQGIVRTLNTLLSQVAHDMRARNTFIANAAHQLRNPIAGIQAMAEAVTSAPTGQEAKTRARELLGAARSASHLANQLLALERADAAKADSFQSVVDMAQVARGTAAQFQGRAMAADVTLTLRDDALALPVLVDEVMLREAISNLIDNALRHGGSGLTEVTLTLAERGGQAILDVTDNGAGIPSTAIPAALERFGQVSEASGSGLGLPIAETMTRQHGGTFEISSGPPGFSAMIRLPLADASGTASAA